MQPQSDTVSWLMQKRPAIAFALAIIVALTSCAPLPEDNGERSRRAPDSNELEQLPTSSSVEIYRRPNTSLQPYTKIVLRTLAVELRSGWYPDRDAPQNHPIHTARQRMAMIFANEMERALESSGRYTVVSEPGSDVLEFRPKIIDLYVKAVDDEVSSSDTVSTYEINDAELTLTADLRDSTSGTVFYRIYDHRTASIGKLVLNSVEARNEEFQHIVAEWGDQLRRALAQSQ